MSEKPSVVLGVGLPKCGTSSLAMALSRSGLAVGHQHVHKRECFGPMMLDAYQRGEDPMAPLFALKYIGATQLDFVNHTKNVWAQLNYGMLARVLELHPDAVFMLPTRPLDEHVRSIEHWQDFRWLITQYDIPGLPAGCGKKDEQLCTWITGHYERIRKLCEGHRLFEFDIRQPDLVAMSEAVGVTVARWPWRMKNNKLARQLRVAARQGGGDVRFNYGQYQTPARMALKKKAIPLPNFQGKTVLDVGCDHGYWCHLASERGAARVLGLDRGREVKGEGPVDLVARNRALGWARCEFERIDLGKQWHTFGTFDVVLCLSMYHHAYGNCGDHAALWHWLWQHTKGDGVLLWEGPLDTRDSVSARWAGEGYTREAILTAASEYFEVEQIGPALHESTREVLRCTPKERAL